MAAPVILRLNRGRCIFIGCVHVTLAVILLLPTVSVLTAGIFDGIVAFGLAAGLFFLALGLSNFALAWRRPVALRLDAKGASGYYLDPVTWDEVVDVRAVRLNGRDAFGFELRDPEKVLARQPLLARFRSRALCRSFGLHLAMPLVLLQSADITRLAAQAKAFLAAASSKRS
ncbi:MAG: hypothetical protein AAF744_08470 [Pseudomonadota bacterium]